MEEPELWGVSWQVGGSGVAFSEWWEERAGLFPSCHGVDVQDIFLSALGFLDDICFVSGGFDQAQMMLNDAVLTFGSVGLQLNIAKIKWMANKHCNCQEGLALRIGRVLIPSVDHFVILVSMIFIDGNEGPALRHRSGKAWGVFHKWAHILT